MYSIKNKIKHHLFNYQEVQSTFSWDTVAKELSSLPHGKGLNIAYEAIDRHIHTPLNDRTAFRFIRKNKTYLDVSYFELHKQTSKFANVLDYLGIQKGDVVCSLAGRIPELYYTALGSLKCTAVYCPLFSVFGPEPVFQRLSRGNATFLVTTSVLFEKTVQQLLERLPLLRYILIIGIKDHISDKVLSFSKLMEEAKTEFSIPQTNIEDAALLHFTSGTTGMPKCVLLQHNNVVRLFTSARQCYNFNDEDILP